MRKWINLCETFETGFSGIHGAEVVIYKNPSRKEWKECEQYHNVRAFVVGNDLYIWNPFAAVHQMVREHLGLDGEAISVTISAIFGQECFVTITDNVRKTKWWHNPEVVDAIHNCHYLNRVFADIEINYYDEDIGGRWDDPRQISASHLHEGVNDHYLYHGTDLMSAISILLDNKIDSSQEYDHDPTGVSLTRDYWTAREFGTYWERQYPVVFVLDAQKLRQSRHKITPRRDTTDNPDEFRAREAEEMVLSDLTPLSQFLVSVNINRGACEHALADNEYLDWMIEEKGGFPFTKSRAALKAAIKAFAKSPLLNRVRPRAANHYERGKSMNETYGRWDELIESADPGEKRAKLLIKQYGGKPMSYDKLSPSAQKAITHWMMVDGDNPSYKTNLQYAYANIPVGFFMREYWGNIISEYPEMTEEYPSAEQMLFDYQNNDPRQVAGFMGYDFSKHDLIEPWPVILGSDFFEDGNHRLAWYVYNGVEHIPAIFPVNKRRIPIW